jgi:glycosyltransferase involved in cell wall biosynthesis
MDISVVLPVYNNAASLPELVKRLTESCQMISPNYELLFVNDGSHDGSLQILHEFADVESRVKVICLSRNFGQHPAISAGFERAQGKAIILMDADLQDRPEDIPMLLRELHNSKSDVIYTLKQDKNRRISHRLTSALYHYVFSKLVGSNVPLNIGTFRAFNQKVLHALLEFPEVNILYGPLMFYIGFKSKAVSLQFIQRPHGKSSYTFLKRLKLAANSLISYTDLPHQLTMAIGALLLLFTLSYVILVVVQYILVGSSLPAGTTIVILLICTLVGAVLISLGIIGSYVFRIYQEVLRRPRYLVRSTRNLN